MYYTRCGVLNALHLLIRVGSAGVPVYCRSVHYGTGIFCCSCAKSSHALHAYGGGGMCEKSLNGYHIYMYCGSSSINSYNSSHLETAYICNLEYRVVETKCYDLHKCTLACIQLQCSVLNFNTFWEIGCWYMSHTYTPTAYAHQGNSTKNLVCYIYKLYLRNG